MRGSRYYIMPLSRIRKHVPKQMSLPISPAPPLPPQIRFIPVLSKERALEAQRNLRRNLFQRGDIGYEEKGVLSVDLFRAEK